MRNLLPRRTLPLIVAFAAITLGFALPASAQMQILPECALVAGEAPPSLNCALQTFANIAQIILGVTGSLALMMFVWGGFKFLTAAGDDSKINEGKTVIKNAVIGIFIIFTAGYAVDYGIRQLRGGSSEGGQQQVITGSQCTTEAGVEGRSFTDRQGCFATCSDLGNYACKVPTTSEEPTCYAGLCPGAENVRCCPR